METMALLGFKNFFSLYPIKLRQNEIETPQVIAKRGQDELPAMLNAIWQQVQQITQNPGLNDRGRRDELEALIQKKFLPQLQKFRENYLIKTINEAEKLHAKLRGGLSDLKIDPANAAAAVLRWEIRQHFLKLEKFERIRFFKEQIDAGNVNVFQAVTELNGFYGLLDEQVIEQGRQWLSITRQPDVAQEYLDTRKAAENLNRDLTRIVNEIAPFTGGKLSITAELPPDIDLVGQDLEKIVAEYKEAKAAAV